MKLFRFPWSASFGLIAILILGSANNSVSQPVPSLIAESSIASAPAQNESDTLSSGSFVTGEHPTQGIVNIKIEGGKRILELDSSFQTSSLGPDLVVALHRSQDVIGSTQPPAYSIEEGDYLVLAPLKSFTGAQTYEIPDSVPLDDFTSVIIWCRRFNATFGAATLAS